MTQIKGIDVSHWNGNIDWNKVAGDGVKFAFLKATEGTSYSVVSWFNENVPKAISASIDVGAYHYAKFGTIAEAKAEVAYFLSVIKGNQLTYPAVLDLEENKSGASKTVLTDAAIAFLDALTNAGYVAMLYTGKAFLDEQLDESRLTTYALWIARYNSTLGRNADIWQYTNSGKVNGIIGDVDLDWSYRDFVASKPNQKPPTSIVAYPGYLIKKGSRSKDVERIQRAVGVTPDGIFGPITDAAVKAYQKRKGLVVDGIVGPRTWAVMF
ncbi:Autolytic lysozyme [Neobacillus rhizosphaerae]|uniref:Autolytic lysozyme n=1 Tax=Neobacillus rhizosphaerae TaxID=2880965 RepID=A0ABM9EP91_9BACI|nr:GH25 family lysozyme [Neobacillus rhizosphaerae]CAH2714407.1 Autolytic lysozyme [Neobacillus rhizosphaerae]